MGRGVEPSPARDRVGAGDHLCDLVWSTPWIDTHEHLVEERRRLRATAYRFVDVWGEPELVPADWTGLISHYATDDLVSAGLGEHALDLLRRDDVGPLEKWDLAADALDAAWHTGYLRAARLSAELVCGVPLTRDTIAELDARCRAIRHPGYYERILRDSAGVSHCHVHSLEHDPFVETATPDVVRTDLSLVPLVFGTSAEAPDSSLDGYLGHLEAVFARARDRAVAVKCAWAYFRPLDVERSPRTPGLERAFARVRAGVATADERRRVQDHLFAHCLDLAADTGLPLKLHLGYLAGTRRHELRWVARHVEQVVDLVQSRPELTFVLMHMAWPAQETLMAIAKHHPNVVVDLCWAWIVAPLATREFVARFLTSVPSNRLLCFGGDYLTVETVPGHAELARRGLAAALEDLIRDGWLDPSATPSLVERLMRGNARAVFGERGATGRR